LAYKIVKTEHNGAKHGNGFITKQEAKSGSRKHRRQNWKKELNFLSEELCLNKIPTHEKFITANYRRFGFMGFSICKRCGKPIIKFLRNHELITEND
jgi:hypothetical protein